MSKRVVVWGTGVIGRMVIPEIVKHPLFDLVGVGVSNPDKVGRDAGEICGLAGPIGITATDDMDTLIDLQPDAVVHYGPTAAYVNNNIQVIRPFLCAGIDVCTTAMTPWVWPTLDVTPDTWIAPITEACQLGQASCFGTGIAPGVVFDLLPMSLMGLCSEVGRVRVTELQDCTNYQGDYENETGIGQPPGFCAVLSHREVLIMGRGTTMPMIAHAAGITLDEITTSWDTWVTSSERKTVKGVIAPGEVGAVRFTINGVYRGENRIQFEFVIRAGRDAAPDWLPGMQADTYRVEIEGMPSIRQETAFRFTDGSGRDATAAGCLAAGMRAVNAVPAVNDLPPGWVTALDLPLIPGTGTIR